MRSPFLVPLVLNVTLILLATQIDASRSSISRKSAKIREMDDTAKVKRNGRPELKDEKVIAAIETNLMSLFGFSKRPKPSRDVVIPEAMKELYKRQTGMDVDSTNFALPGKQTSSANTVRSFTHRESSVDEQFSQRHRFRLSFAVDTIPKSEKLHVAELQLSASGAQQILVHDILRPGVRGRHEPILRLVDSRTVRPSRGRVLLDVTPAVQRWLAHPKENHGLLVVVLGGNDSPHVRLKRDVSDDEWREVQPLLFTYTDDGKQTRSGSLGNRSRRAARKQKRRDGKDNCRRHELYVDFVDVGWNDWIVAPPGYDAYYCAGDCPFPLSDHLNSTNHAIVQTLVHSVSPSSAPKACCVPTALSAISMLYLDEANTVVLKNYQEMSIVGCGCR